MASTKPITIFMPFFFGELECLLFAVAFAPTIFAFDEVSVRIPPFTCSFALNRSFAVHLVHYCETTLHS